MKDRSLRELKVLGDLIYVLYFLQTARHYYDAIRLRKNLRPVTIFEAENKAAILNCLFPEIHFSPLEFMKSTDEKANEAIQSYVEYKRWLDKYPENKRTLESFCRWYAFDTAETATLKSNCHDVVSITGAILCVRSGQITDSEYKVILKQCADLGVKLFRGYSQRRVAKTYFVLRDKIYEIESKVINRAVKANECPRSSPE